MLQACEDCSIFLMCISSCVIWCKFITNNIMNYVTKTLSFILAVQKHNVWFRQAAVWIEECVLVGLRWFRRGMECVFIQPWCWCSAGLNSNTNDLSPMTFPAGLTCFALILWQVTGISMCVIYLSDDVPTWHFFTDWHLSSHSFQNLTSGVTHTTC